MVLGEMCYRTPPDDGEMPRILFSLILHRYLKLTLYRSLWLTQSQKISQASCDHIASLSGMPTGWVWCGAAIAPGLNATDATLGRIWGRDWWRLPQIIKLLSVG